MEPAVAFTRAFNAIQKDLRTYIRAVDPSKPQVDLVIRFAQIQAQLADDLRATLDLEPFQREKVVMFTLQAFRDALSTAGLIDDKLSMRLAKEAVAKVGVTVQAQKHDERFNERRTQAMEQLVTENVVQWTWKATLDVATCLFCISRHGRAYPVGHPMLSHPNCRCVPVKEGTRVASGERFLRKLSRANRARVMGKARAKLYESGDYDLDALVDANKQGAVPLRQFGLTRAGKARHPGA